MSVFDIQFGSIPKPQRHRAISAPVVQTINTQQPRRGSISRPSSPTPVFNAGESLIHHRINLMTDNHGNRRIQLLQHEINPDSGELYEDNDVAPPAKGYGIKPQLTREQQRLLVDQRAAKQRQYQQPHLSEAGAQIRNRMIRSTDASLAEHNRQVDARIAAAAVIQASQARETDVESTGSSKLTDGQRDQLAIQAVIQARVRAKEARRQHKLEEQRASLTAQAALLNSTSLSGLGLKLNPDFAATHGAEDEEVAKLETLGEMSLDSIDAEGDAAEQDQAKIAELETLEEIDLDSIDAAYDTHSRSLSRPHHPAGTLPPSPTTAAAPTVAVTYFNLDGQLDMDMETTVIRPRNPIQRATGYLARAASGRTSRTRSVAEEVKGREEGSE